MLPSSTIDPPDSIVICDDELTYACHLQEFLNDTGKVPYPICIYTNPALLLTQQQAGKTRLLIIAESEFQEDLSAAGYKKILILNETNRLLKSGCPSISKYQSSDHVLAAVLEALGEDDQDGDHVQTIRHAGEMHWIGFYTPLTRCLQTSLALTMGEILGEQHKVLYLNFENWPARAEEMESGRSGSVSELLYFNDCAPEKVAGHLQRILRREGGLDLVEPCRDFQELQKVTKEQWLSLFETIRKVSEYEYLLLDLSESVQGLLDILEKCERIYTIRRPGVADTARMMNYEQLLREKKVQELAARTTFCEFPLFPALPVRIADCGRGPLADFVRQQLMEGFGSRNDSRDTR